MDEGKKKKKTTPPKKNPGKKLPVHISLYEELLLPLLPYI